MQDVRMTVAGPTDWEATYRAEAPRLWRALVLQTGSREVASDAVAEAFAQGIARGNAVAKPGPWVWRAAFAIARAEAGLRRNEPREVVDRAIEDPAPIVDLLDDLTVLSPMQRSAVVLHYFAGYPLGEAAAILGSTRSALGVHLFRARAVLRARWEADDER
jgi:RNA polymerase sigma-70 factor (ECF subfamily)